MKVLNLYAGIGGNRKLWPEECEVTAVENNEDIVSIYMDFFPDDTVLIEDAHEYLLANHKRFDFIWSSPPCPTHSRMRMLWSGDGKDIKNKTTGPSFKFPDMKLYEEILFLKHFFKGKWVVENVISYYDPLIKPYECDSHYFWSNFNILYKKRSYRGIRNDGCLDFTSFGFDLTDYDLPSRTKITILNNLVNPKTGLHIFNCAFKEKQVTLQ